MIKNFLFLILLFLLLSKALFAQTDKVASGLKADAFYPFHEGLAIISYGKSDGVIDKLGNLVIPYNKYVFEKFGLGSLEPNHGFINGGCIVKNIENGKLGMVDTKGTLIIPTEYILVFPYDDEGWSIVTDVKENDFFINKAGVKIPVTNVFYYYRQGIISSNGSIEDLFNGGATRNRAIGGKRYFGSFSKNISPGSLNKGMTYFNRNSKQVINTIYSSAEPFREGLACVSKVNEFGETKFGFIDMLGNTIIPFKFTNKPGNFYNGLAYVEPTNKNDFAFAFINKSGDVVIKEKSAKPVLVVDPHFEDGYFRMLKKDLYGNDNVLFIIDSTGKENNIVRSIKDKIGSISMGSNTFYPFENKTQIFRYIDRTGSRGTAFVNIETGKIIYTNFSNIGKFDSVSGLAVAHDDKLGDVYINQEGNIQVTMANKSEW